MRLDRAREALDRAGRLLDGLPAQEDDATAFRDAVPYVLAQLDVVTSIINEDSHGHRTESFSSWWNGEHPLKDALHELRNAEFKRQEKRTARNAIVRPPTVRAGLVKGELVNLPGDSGQQTGSRMFWTFTSGGFSGQEVIPTLRKYYDHLAITVIPTAEQLLS